MRHKILIVLLGGALSSFFVMPFLLASSSSHYKNEHPVNLPLANIFGTKSALAYDQMNTHPALTSEAVNFYNLNFPKNKISEKEKELLIKGAINEDILPRPMNHFYDPVHNKGWIGYRSSKIWARSSEAQQIGRSLLALNPLLEKTSEDWPDDFSYERALLDYAKGNRERAFESFGHVLHLLEDANVPEHTRNDTHIDIGHHTGSPYEHEMAKWNSQNFHVATQLFQSGKKPILFNDLGNYFDDIAKYSNGYFFSEDTIFSDGFKNPDVDFWEVKNIGTNIVSIGYKKDELGRYPLVLKPVNEQTRNFTQKKLYTLDSSLILDGYWSRLSKDFVLHGAGALKMFLEQGEEVKKEYEKQMAAKENKSWLASIFGSKKSGIDLVKNTLAEIESPRSDLVGTQAVEVKPSLSPKVEPLADQGSTLKSNLSNPNSSPKIESLATETPAPIASILPVETPTLTPTETPKIEPTSFPTVINKGGGGVDVVIREEVTPTPTPSPSSTPTPTPTPTPEPEAVDMALRKIVINEIAWMGTATSSNDEWLELYNPSSKSVDLTGWTLKAQDGIPNISLSPIRIGAFGFYLLERTSDSTISNLTADQIYTGALGNSGEVLELRDASGNLQDFVSKTSSGWYAGSNGSTGSPQAKASMERIDPKVKGNSQSNWGTNNGVTKNGLDAGGGAINGTPKAKNSLYVTQKPNKVNNLAVSGLTNLNYIFLTWSASNDPDTASSSLSYDLRYATKSFDTADDWNKAKVAFQGEALKVDNLVIQDFNKTYYFALKVKDNDNNYSDISNQVSYGIPSAVSTSGWPMYGLNSSHTLKASFLGPKSSATGTKWGIQLLSSPPTNFGQPIIGPNGNIYFGTSNGTVAQLLARSSANTEVWPYSGTAGATPGTPAVLVDNSVLFGYSNIGTNLTRLDSAGTAKFENNIGQITSVTVGQDGTSYFTSSSDKILAVKLDGTQKWLTYQTGLTGYVPALLDDGKIYVSSRLSGVPNIYSFDGQTGALLWSKTMSTNSPSCCGVSDVSYDSTNDFLYAGAEQYILKVDRSGNNWEQFLADRSLGWGVTTTMISQDTNNLIFGLDFSLNNPASKSAVYAVNKSSKAVAWKYQVDAKINKQIALDSGGNAYFSTQNGWVYSLNQNGGLNWKYDLGGTTSAYPVIGEGVLYQVLDGGRLVKMGE